MTKKKKKELLRLHTFEHGDHIFLPHKGHLAVDLREFRLPVRTQLLIAETLRNLRIRKVSKKMAEVRHKRSME
jgi:hypothetical protein